MSRTQLADLRRGMRIHEIYLVETANLKTARNGNQFIQMVLRDSTASMKAMRWEASDAEFRRIDREPFVLVTGRVEEFQGNPQIICDELETLSPDDAQVRPEDFLPRTRYDIDAMKSSLLEFIESIGDPSLRALVERVYARPVVERGLRVAPAGKAMHHAYVGGLLEHVLSLANLAEALCRHYPWLDRSVLIAGVALHDIGKTAELKYDVGFSYSDEGQLIGHISIVHDWMREAARELDEEKTPIDAERFLEIEHLVLSHHGKLEFGSPKLPQTPEAIVFHYLDNIDAKLAGVLDLFHSVRPEKDGNRWSDWTALTGAKLFFPHAMDERLAQLEPGELPGPGPAPRTADGGDVPEPGSLF